MHCTTVDVLLIYFRSFRAAQHRGFRMIAQVMIKGLFYINNFYCFCFFSIILVCLLSQYILHQILFFHLELATTTYYGSGFQLMVLCNIKDCGFSDSTCTRSARPILPSYLRVRATVRARVCVCLCICVCVCVCVRARHMLQCEGLAFWCAAMHD